MPIPRPPKGVRWLATQPSTYDVLITVCASAIGLSSSYNYAVQDRRGLAIAVALGTIAVVGLSLVKHGISLRAASKKDSIHELEGCLYTLEAVLAPATGCRLRLAVHVPVQNELEQVTEYIGASPKTGRIGRRFPANAGIIGKAFREKDVFVGRRANDDYEAYVQELVTEWNYTEETARRLNPGAMEWMAVPFYDSERQRVDAILYLDASQRGFFTPERQEAVLAAVNGIAVFIGKRYS